MHAPVFLERHLSGCPVERLPSFLHAVQAGDTVQIWLSDRSSAVTSLTVLSACPTKVDAGSVWDEEEVDLSPEWFAGKTEHGFVETAR